MLNIKQIAADNIVPLIIFIFMAGGFSTVVTLQGITIRAQGIEIQEIQENKVSKTELELQHNLLWTGQESLKNRVRRKIDGPLKDQGEHITRLRVAVAVIQSKNEL